MFIIETYTDKYRNDLLAIFHMHVPKYFAAKEEQDLIMYLDNYAQDFYICKKGEQLIGCGGHNIKGEMGVLSWYIVHPDYHGKGVGTMLVQHNLDMLKQKGFTHIRVRTSQLVDKFYEKFGFKLIVTQKNYWALGLDLYEMEMFV